MKTLGKGSRAASTFNEGEYLKNFKAIEEALEENMRAEQERALEETLDSELPFASVEQLAAERRVDTTPELPEEPLEQEPLGGREVPFASSSQELQSTRLPIAASQPEAVLYRQARRGKRSRRGRQGVWRLLPHIGHRRRHWLQKNFSRVLALLVLGLALVGFFLVRVCPRMALAALDRMSGATLAHAEGNYEQAITLYQQFLQSSPETSLQCVQAHYYLGCCYEIRGDQARAQEEYLWVKQAYQRFRGQLSQEHRERRRYDDNIPDVFANALYSLGELAWQHQERGQAGEYFRLLLGEFPNYVFASEARERLRELEPPEGPISQTPETQSLETKGQGDGANDL